MDIQTLLFQKSIEYIADVFQLVNASETAKEHRESETIRKPISIPRRNTNATIAIRVHPTWRTLQEKDFTSASDGAVIDLWEWPMRLNIAGILRAYLSGLAGNP